MEEIERKVDDVVKTATTSEAAKESGSNNDIEKALTVIANIVLVFGIIAAVLCLFKMVFTYTTHYTYDPSGFITTIMVLFFSIISWCLMRVIANMSMTLKEINKKMK